MVASAQQALQSDPGKGANLEKPDARGNGVKGFGPRLGLALDALSVEITSLLAIVEESGSPVARVVAAATRECHMRLNGLTKLRRTLRNDQGLSLDRSWADRQVARVEKLADRLPTEAPVVARQLDRLPEGCQWKIEQWQRLDMVLTQGSWSLEDLKLAMWLLGLSTVSWRLSLKGWEVWKLHVQTGGATGPEPVLSAGPALPAKVEKAMEIAARQVLGLEEPAVAARDAARVATAALRGRINDELARLYDRFAVNQKTSRSGRRRARVLNDLNNSKKMQNLLRREQQTRNELYRLLRELKSLI